MNKNNSEGNMKTYYIRINCTGFEDFAVKAKNKEDAINYAEHHFQCEHGGGEFCEMLHKESATRIKEVDEVFYPASEANR